MSAINNGNSRGWLAKPPTCWQFFGFEGPTNRHNLDQRKNERLTTTMFGYEITDRSRYDLIWDQYNKCLAELDPRDV